MYKLECVKNLKRIYNFDFKTGDPEKYLKILSKPTAFRFQAYTIAKYGYEDLFDIIYPQEYDDAMCGAGNLKLVSHFMNLGATEYDDALYSAIKHNHRHVIDFFISLGADIYIVEAERCNHVNLIELLKNDI